MFDVQQKSSIAARRRQLGWSVYRLAKEAGIRRWHTVADIDAGKRKPHKATLEKLDRALSEAERAAL